MGLTTNSRLPILCVEDHEDTCELVKIVLAGYEVLSASNYDEAVELFDRRRFSVIFLDFNLGATGTGADVCRYIRARDRETPVYFCSASILMTNELALSEGAQGVIPKGEEFFLHLLQTVRSSLGDIETDGVL